MSKNKAPICRCSYGSWMSSPCGVFQFPPKFIDGVYFCFGVKSMLLETLCAVQLINAVDGETLGDTEGTAHGLS